MIDIMTIRNCKLFAVGRREVGMSSRYYLDVCKDISKVPDRNMTDPQSVYKDLN